MADDSGDIHYVRITSQGKIKNWVSFALKSFQEHPELPLTFHTIPPTPSGSKSNPKDANNERKQKLPSSTALVPRLVSVVEIVKREYMKELKEKKASRMKGLYQYNQIGLLGGEEGQTTKTEEDEDDEHVAKEEKRAEKIIEALSGKNHVRQTQTPFMRITLCTIELPHLQAAGATYQPPETRKLSKSAKLRAAKRRRREHAEAGEEDTGDTGKKPVQRSASPEDVPMEES